VGGWVSRTTWRRPWRAVSGSSLADNHILLRTSRHGLPSKIAPPECRNVRDAPAQAQSTFAEISGIYSGEIEGAGQALRLRILKLPKAAAISGWQQCRYPQGRFCYTTHYCPIEGRNFAQLGSI